MTNFIHFMKCHSSEIPICAFLRVFAYFCGKFAYFLRGGFGVFWSVPYGFWWFCGIQGPLGAKKHIQEGATKLISWG